MVDSDEQVGDGKPRIGLFVTCLVDVFRPEVGFATVNLLEDAGYSVEVPEQGCCGQVNFNSGDADGAREMALSNIRRFEAYDYVVAPSGSCAGTIRRHYPGLFPEDSEEHNLAVEFAEKTYELVSFLYDVAGVHSIAGQWPGSVTYHDGCAGLRDLGIKKQPRALLNSMAGLTLHEMSETEVCCGFGGMFAVKYPDISERIAADKTEAICASGADCLVAGDLGCLMHLEGKLHRDGKEIKVLHVAEVLAGNLKATGAA